MSFATNHYAMNYRLQLYRSCLQLQIWYHIFLDHMVVCTIDMQLNVCNMDTCCKNNGQN
jgi:hypothetical protein